MRLNSGSRKIRIAARQSDLARLQAFRVGDAIRQAHSEIEVEYVFRESLGDKNQSDPLWRMPEKGVFTEDFVEDLKSGKVDMVVHSWKDLPTAHRDHTEIAATLQRADQRDVLLFRKDRQKRCEDSKSITILTSSPRRAHNLSGFFKDHLPFEAARVEFRSVRGNVQTRVRKLFLEEVDGLIVAKAALDRLLSAEEPEFAETRSFLQDALTKCRFMVLPLSSNPTAAAQGALAIEIKSGREDLKALLEKINSPETQRGVEVEREILASHGGGCHQKIGVSCLERSYGQITFLRGLTDAGVVLDDVVFDPREKIAPPSSPDEIFPRAGEEFEGFFDRELLPESQWQTTSSGRSITDEKFIWVARETAWPESFVAHAEAIVWAAGVKTWGKLAQRGIWVHGCAEGLGEEEPTRIEALVAVEKSDGSSKIDWLKLTHDQSTDSLVRIQPTYRLVPKTHPPSLAGRTHFFWMSGTSFERALELDPSLKNKHHSSGPGWTHQHLRRILGAHAKIGIYLGLDSWRSAMRAAGKSSS